MVGFIIRILGASGRRLAKLESAFEQFAQGFLDRRALSDYLRSDRRPWRFGYAIYRNKYLAQVVRDNSLLEIFSQSSHLPPRYGFRVDARIVEIPWALAHIAGCSGRLLDAGSSLNSASVLTAPVLANHKVTIATLAPEAVCLWRLGVSYVFGDLRNLDFRDDWFDAVVCISTIEHVGMDNSMYAGTSAPAKRSNSKEYVLAVKELRRVLKPGGALYITFPFGEYEDHGWFQQFDAAMVDELVAVFDPAESRETVFRYEPDGWRISDRAACAHCQFFDVRASKYFDHNSTIEYPSDYPAGERAVMCLELRK